MRASASAFLVIDQRVRIRGLQKSSAFMEPEPTATPSSSTSSQMAFPFDRPNSLILEGFWRTTLAAEMRVYERVLKHMVNMGGECKNTATAKKRVMMRLRMDGFRASLCRSSWPSSFRCPGGEYEYIDVVMEENGGAPTTRLIVDIDFKSQFELARPTQAYKQLSGALPSIFVGTEEKLEKAVSLLCLAARRSLKEKGLHVPPWRTTGYVQSKWLVGWHAVPAILLPSAVRIEMKGSVGHRPLVIA